MANESKKERSPSCGIPATVAGSRATGRLLPFHRDWILGVFLVFAVIATYLPAWRAGFIWDDGIHVTNNPCVVGPLGLKEIWTTSAGKFCPLVFTTFWLEHALWGLAPLPYHLVNVLLHGACSILLWRVLRGLQIPGAWLGAALWALHPVQVESVAWISEMKNTESGLFFLLSILFFMRWLKEKNPDEKKDAAWSYGLTLLFAFLAMTGKSSTVILPVVLCLCAWWVEGRWRWRNMAKLAPIFLMSIIASALTIWTPAPDDAYDPQWLQSWPQRLAIAGDAVWFYIGKLLWPHPLIAIYPRWQIDAGQWFSYLPLLAVIVVLVVLWLKRDSWGRPWFFVFAYFLAALLPVLGFVETTFSRYSFVVDHFQYLASMGAMALIGAGLCRLANFIIPQKMLLQSGLCAGVLVILGVLSWNRASAFENEKLLWTDELVKYPNCSLGHSNLGDAYFQEGNVDEAIDQFQKALEIDPHFGKTHYNLGVAFFQKGQVNEAIEQYHEALKINPNDALAHNNLGNAIAKEGKSDESKAEFEKALEINPNYAEAHNNLGNFLLQKGRVDEAVAQFQKALEISPDYPDARNNLGCAYYLKGRLDEAITQFKEALRLQPGIGSAQTNLAQAEALARRQAASP
jgi:tetratricopeptide (TPR) repeat protein